MLKFQPSGFEKRSVQTRLGQMAYYMAGKALSGVVTQDGEAQHPSESVRPTILFFHNFGGGASAYEWSKVYAALSVAYNVMAPDLIGWGASAHPERRYSTQDYLNVIEDFIEQVVSTPVIAVASSFTGGLVARLATGRPELFQKLFLTCPAGFRDFGSGAGRRIPEPIINAPFLDKVIYTLGATNEIAVRKLFREFSLCTGRPALA